MEVKINIEDYLSEEDIKEECRDYLRYSIEHYLSNESDFERIMSNISYRIVHKAVDECFNQDLSNILTGKVIDVINGLSGYNIFRRKDNIVDRDDTVGQKILDAAVKNNKDLIDLKVKETIKNFDYDYIASNIQDYIYDAIIESIRGNL